MTYAGKLRDPLLDRLFEAILTLRTVDECYQFFEDICTVAELKSLAQRLEVAKMLEANYTYSEIAARTGASTATISRVKRALNYGADGYKLVLSRLSWRSELVELNDRQGEQTVESSRLVEGDRQD